MLAIVRAMGIADIQKPSEKIVEVREFETDRDRNDGGTGSNTAVDVIWWDRVELWAGDELPTLNENKVKAGMVSMVRLLA